MKYNPYFLFLVIVFPLSAQIIYSPYIKGMRVTGAAGAKFPMALLDSHPITISFDVDKVNTENFHIKVFHCTKNWTITASPFINDEFRNYTKYQIPYEVAPNGVKQYRWTYSVSLPGFAGLEKFQHSGNYKFEVWNDDQSTLLAEGKFFVVEAMMDTVLRLYNRYLPSEISPWNQVNKAVLSFAVPLPGIGEMNPLYSGYFKTVNIYCNREIESPHRIDVDDRDPNTFVDGYGTNDLKFIIDNIQPGNEYRRLDLRNTNFYPPDEILHPRDGADLSRWLIQGAKDQDGTSILMTDTRYADYVQFQFDLARPEENTQEKIYVVGDFNGWMVNDQWQLKYHIETKHYKLLASLRRGVYDYQYVLNGNDWVTLEGNDWRTISIYTALLYYSDPDYGGFDRILLTAQAKSPGGIDQTSP